MGYFSPHVQARPCRWCRFFVRMDACGAAVCCQGGFTFMQAAPQRGCAFFEREPGADDDLAPPAFRSDEPATRAGSMMGIG